MVEKLRLTLACWSYDRTIALYDGTVKPEGLELNYLPLWPQETFYRMLKYKEFDVAELSFGAYIASFFEDKPFVAIPVFPSRSFRHNSIYVNVNSGIREPQDLIGRRVGVPEYRQTAAVWIKGILSDMYGVKPESVTYYSGPLEDPSRRRKFFTVLAETDVLPKYKEIKVVKISDGKNLSDMLVNGEIDALYSALVPSSFKTFPDKVTRLFKNYRELEIEYYKKTKIFPIMHVIVIRRDVYEENRWIAKSIYKAFEESKNVAFEKFTIATGTLHYSLPWLFDHYEETVKIMGEDYWPYGLKKNYYTIETFIRYMYEQGIIPTLVKPEELFAKEVTDT
ncbi:MAG: ABC transporter substrate-binding protein [Saccharolobus sp.]|uniref:ABC transporter substrate-binding protein n=1 Tax=Saccharolobus TaxID=2100760 RepID=UPI001F0ECF74|nr:ABC transporter substrate-binding protein [Saccharolobus shibatae]MCH4815827.1 ABC transporter substrate-binding protein [Saccharolobus shibatae]